MCVCVCVIESCVSRSGSIFRWKNEKRNDLCPEKVNFMNNLLFDFSFECMTVRYDLKSRRKVSIRGTRHENCVRKGNFHSTTLSCTFPTVELLPPIKKPLFHHSFLRVFDSSLIFSLLFTFTTYNTQYTDIFQIIFQNNNISWQLFLGTHENNTKIYFILLIIFRVEQ